MKLKLELNAIIYLNVLFVMAIGIITIVSWILVSLFGKEVGGLGFLFGLIVGTAGLPWILILTHTLHGATISDSLWYFIFFGIAPMVSATLLGAAYEFIFVITRSRRKWGAIEKVVTFTIIAILFISLGSTYLWANKIGRDYAAMHALRTHSTSQSHSNSSVLSRQHLTPPITEPESNVLQDLNEFRQSMPFSLREPMDEVNATLIGHNLFAASPNSKEIHLRQAGLWLFFDGDRKIRTIRIETPFVGDIDKIRIGEVIGDIKSTLGEPIKNPWPYAGNMAYLYRKDNRLIRCDISMAGIVTTIFLLSDHEIPANSSQSRPFVGSLNQRIMR